MRLFLLVSFFIFALSGTVVLAADTGQLQAPQMVTTYGNGNLSLFFGRTVTEPECVNGKRKLLYIGVGKEKVTMEGLKGMHATIMAATLADKKLRFSYNADKNGRCWVSVVTLHTQ